MPVFEKYAKYYDLIYKDKDYRKEAKFVHERIQKNLSSVHSILEMGCGTGRHAAFLSDKGYDITAVDASKTMLDVARASMHMPRSDTKRVEFIHGNLKNFRLDRRFDVVLSLFHVMSYQQTNEDLAAAFNTAVKHLKKDGIFFFDFWYGPAVLTEKPSVRVKQMEDRQLKITRIAEPVMHHNDNIVDVNYTFFILNKQSGNVEELKEKHRMRYLFAPEIMQFLASTNLQLVEFAEWLTARSPGVDTWNVYCIAKAN